MKNHVAHALDFARHHALLALASIFAMLAITYPALWLLAPLSLGLFFYVLRNAKTPRAAFFNAFIFGLVASGSGTWWFWDTLPLDWLGVAKATDDYYALMAWGQVTLTLGFVTAVTAFPIWWFRKHALWPIATAFIWVLVEQAKMWGFAFLTYEERSLMGAHFSSTALGYPLAEQSYLLQMAAAGGLLALNFAVALMGALLVYAALSKEMRARLLLGAGMAAIALIGLLTYPLIEKPTTYEGDPLTIALYTSDFTLKSPKGDQTAAYLSALSDVATTVPNADIVILPEEYRLEPQFKDAAEKERALRSIFKQEDPLLVTANHEANGRDFSLVLSYERIGGERLGSYSKMFLMPGGEYMPLLLKAAFKLKPDQGFDRHQKTLAARALPGEGISANAYRGWIMSGFVCSDFLSPSLHNDARNLGANLMVNSANPAWFHYSKSLYEKTQQILKVHTVHARAYYLYAANGSPSFVINPKGEIIAETPWHFVGTIGVSIP